MSEVDKYYGYAGSVLYIDLTTKLIRNEPLDLDLAKKFIGGTGVGLKLLNELLKPKTDPLSPENVIVFGTGPLVGTTVPGSGKCYLSTKYAMPASRDRKKYFISSSMFGSRRFGTMMKSAGYDHIVITGSADKPCYLKVTDEVVEICNASDIWGKDVYETGKILRERHGGKTRDCGTWAIGRAGENLVRPSLGFTDDWWNAGRFAGAVAGAKNLKAVVTLGEKDIKIAHPQRYMELIGNKLKEIRSHPNYQTTPSMGDGKTGRLLKETMVGIKGCSGSQCACKSIHEVKEGEYKGSWFGGSYPGFTGLIHTKLQLKDYFKNYGEAFKLVEIMNRNGLCLVTTMNMVWFVTKLYERGILSGKDMGGIEPVRGDLKYYILLIEKIINREDIGAVMAEGWYPLCEKLGVDASIDLEAGCAITKGVDLIVDVRIWPSLFSPDPIGFSPCLGLGSIVHAKSKQTHSATYRTNKQISFDDVTRDAEKMGLRKEEMDRIFNFKEGSFNTGRLEKHGADAETAYNALGVCSGALRSADEPIRDIPWLSEVYSALTGFEISPRQLLRAGERIWNLEKLLNVREKFSREDDKIPSLYLKNIETPLKTPKGDRYLTNWFGKRLTREDLERMLDDYYDERGWDIKQGVPTEDKLVELGLNM